MRRKTLRPAVVPALLKQAEHGQKVCNVLACFTLPLRLRCRSVPPNSLHVKIVYHAKHGVLLEGRSGVGDEGAGNDLRAIAKKITWWQASLRTPVNPRSN